MKLRVIDLETVASRVQYSRRYEPAECGSGFVSILSLPYSLP